MNSIKPNRRYYLPLCLLLFVHTIFAQFGDERIINSCDLCNPRDVFSADLDGDGDLDVLSASFEDAKVAWYENMGGLAFSTQKVISTKAESVTDIYASDLDNDGDIDVLFATQLNKVGWYQNDGTGNFSEQILLDTQAIAAWRVYASDLDNDGDMDVLSTSNGSGRLVWYENDGVGNFSEAIILLSAEILIGTVHTADIDNDGDLDIVSVSQSFLEGLLWLENDGRGNFKRRDIPSSEGDWLLSVRADDLDGDGDIDIIASSIRDEQMLMWYENDGQGNFLEEKIIPTEFVFHEEYDLDRTHEIYTIDIDTDGDIDVCYTQPFIDKVVWHENDGRGNFSQEHIISIKVDSPKGIHANDLDGDGDVDILAAIEYDDKIMLYENDGAENFREESIIISQGESTRHSYASDLDGDGDIDILTSSASNNRISWYENDGSGNFAEQKIIASSIAGFTYVHASDIDSDGDIDILSASDLDDRIVWYENDGLGNFSEPKIVAKGTGDTNIFFTADLDGDGDLDVLLESSDINEVLWAAHEVVWYKNDGLGNFSEEQFIFNQEGSDTKIYANDLDGDNDLDILSVHFSTREGKIVWYKNDSIGNFSEAQFITLGNFSEEKVIALEMGALTSIYTDDLDGDGDLDIVALSFSQNTIVWFENYGNGNFSDQLLISTITRPNEVYTTDLDGDNLQDLVIISLKENKLSWMKNTFDGPIISGVAFWDENSNGIIDSSEHRLENFPVTITPNISSYTDKEGRFRFYVDKDSSYTITTVADVCWQLSTDSASYHIQFPRDTFYDTDFGFQPSSDSQHTQVRIHSAPTRCGFTVPFQITLENDGCHPAKGQYGLIVSPLLTLIESQVEPDEIRADTLLWNHEELFGSGTEALQLTFEIAGTDFIGDSIRLTGLSYIEKEQGQLDLVSTYDYSSEIRCAYDPNDKLVQPNRLGQYEENYTLFGEPLEYTIRFQNTGNDTAFNVVIRDTLDKHLDWTTFKPITASHTYEALLYKDGAIEFSFRNILLPDSTINEPLSHGFITYKIQTQKELPENTPIENTASIYFDFNPPIVTNTTQNILVSAFPTTTLTKDFLLNSLVEIYPNPFKDFLTIKNNNVASEQLLFSIFDITGREIKRNLLHKGTEQISIDTAARGFYFYQVINTKGELIVNGKLVRQ